MKFGDLLVGFDLLDEHRITCGRGLALRPRDRQVPAEVFHRGRHIGFADHRHEVRFAGDVLVHHRVVGAAGDHVDHADGLVDVALADDAAEALFHVRSRPRRIEIDHLLECPLDVQAGAALLGGGQQHPDPSVGAGLHQAGLGLGVVVVVYERDLFPIHASGHQGVA